MSIEDTRSLYVREHAERAVLGLRGVDRAEAGDLGQVLTVETVHDLRTSLRRLRATLRSFPAPPVPSHAAPATTDGDLRFVARALGELRDTDVLTEQLLAQISCLPLSPEQGPVREDLASALAARRRSALAQVAERRGDQRWGRAADLLDSWQQAPPLLVDSQPLHLLESAREDVGDRLLAAGGDLHALHSARKAAKRWRYAAEMLLPVASAAAEHYEQATGIHEQLGRLQDAVVATEFLDEVTRSGDLADGTARTVRLLAQHARRTIREIAAEAPRQL